MACFALPYEVTVGIDGLPDVTVTIPNGTIIPCRVDFLSNNQQLTALIGKELDDEVQVQAPGGEKTYFIESIQYI